MARRSSRSVNVAVGTTATKVLGSNSRRTAIQVSAPQLYRLTVSFDPGVTAGSGVVIHPGVSPWVFCAYNWDESLTGELWAVCDPTGETIGFTEVME